MTTIEFLFDNTQFLTLQQISELLKVSLNTAQRKIKRVTKEFPHFSYPSTKISQNDIFPRDLVLRLLPAEQIEIFNRGLENGTKIQGLLTGAMMEIQKLNRNLDNQKKD